MEVILEIVNGVIVLNTQYPIPFVSECLCNIGRFLVCE